MRSLLGGIALAFIFGAIGDAQAQTTNCTSSVIGNQIYTNCYGGGSPVTGPRFYSSPALQGKTLTFSFPDIMRKNEALRTKRLQNKLLELEIQRLERQLQQQ